MQTFTSPRFLKLQNHIRSRDVLEFSTWTCSSRSCAYAHATSRKFSGGAELQLRLDRSWINLNLGTYKIRAPASRLGRQRNRFVAQALTDDESTQTSRNMSSLSCPDNEITKALDSNVSFRILKRIGSKLFALGLSTLVLLVPEFAYTDIAQGSQLERLGQIRQGVTIIERAVEGLSKFRIDQEAGVQVLDKALTVVSGSTIVDPQVLDQKVEAFIRGETDIPEEFRKTVLDTLQGSWSNLVDVVTNFNPVTWSESAGASFQGFVEAGVERFAAFEISALVTLGSQEFAPSCPGNEQKFLNRGGPAELGKVLNYD